MPTFHGYHGDSQSSSIYSPWDWIQAHLKCLIPNYQPSHIDDSSTLSYQSFHKQNKICEEIKEVCNNIYATLSKMIEEEENSDPENLDSTTHSPTNTYSFTSYLDNSANLDHNSIPILDQTTTHNRIAEIQQSRIQIQIAKNLDLHEEVNDANFELAKERVNQPPPKPPELILHRVVSCNGDGTTEVQGDGHARDDEAAD
ncbi:hypothetical protein PIB30_054296 [Stylosanthes scabra]|uniref:Uncharacterized protein n=1 Tax=Stylosanthes scabra TaxID=79078 RepID=A0ABU6YG62_9FABA|nr:hypothetical protein [Stylosanthes scabra]